jgi:hypothetical protein
MATYDDIWIDARDAWGVDRLSWDDEDDPDEDDAAPDRRSPREATLEDSRY